MEDETVTSGNATLPLTREERFALWAAEQAVQQYLAAEAEYQAAWVSAGRSLARIRERKLYRAQYRTFQEYVRERWGFSAGRARQLIRAAEGAPEAATEREARRLLEHPEPAVARAEALLREELGEAYDDALRPPGPQPDFVWATLEVLEMILGRTSLNSWVSVACNAGTPHDLVIVLRALEHAQAEVEGRLRQVRRPLRAALRAGLRQALTDEDARTRKLAG